MTNYCLPIVGHYSRVCEIAIGSLASLLAFTAFASEAAGSRPLRIDDQFAVERFYGADDLAFQFCFQPAGKAVAFVVGRPLRENRNFAAYFDADRADVYLSPGPDQPGENLTEGAKDGTGFWFPQWSPDGRYLAMLSTRGATPGIRLWVYDSRTRQLRLASNRSLDYATGGGELPYRWIDASHVLAFAMPDGMPAAPVDPQFTTQQIAPVEWRKAATGRIPTVSVLDSELPHTTPERDAGRFRRSLVAIDVEGGTERISPELRDFFGFQSTDLHNYSDGNHIFAYYAVVEPQGPERKTTISDDQRAPSLSVRFATIDGLVPGIVEPSGFIAQNPWSPNGDELVFLNTLEKPANEGQAFDLHRIKLPSGAVTHCNLKNSDGARLTLVNPLRRFQWTNDGALVVSATPESPMPGEPRGVPASGGVVRSDWYLLARNTPGDAIPKCLTGEMKAVPTELLPLEGRGAFIGLADGAIWKIDVTGKVENLTNGRIQGPVTRIAWSTTHGMMEPNNKGAVENDTRTTHTVILATKGIQGEALWEMDLVSLRISEIHPPRVDAILVGFDPRTQVALFTAAGANGLFIWRTDLVTGRSDIVHEGNAFLRGLTETQFKRIDYISANGEKLRGWILLPEGYEAGKKYPLVAWVYPSTVFKNERVPPYLINTQGLGAGGGYNMQLLAAQGFAIVFPSMPLSPEGTLGDPLLDLAANVTPAVQMAVDLGVADSMRLFVMGHSFGGYATLGLVTQTRRFKAAVALAAWSDNVSYYGSIDPRIRYTDAALKGGTWAADWLLGKGGYSGGMGNPPWKDFGRYLRNSPIFYVDRVTTPLMAVYGDLDYTMMEQGEEFFVSLHRQHKPARMLRYWGETHVIASPANLRDLWSRIFAWFDDFGDIQRDEKGELVWDGDHVRSRNGSPALAPADFLKLERFFDPKFGKPEGGWPDYSGKPTEMTDAK